METNYTNICPMCHSDKIKKYGKTKNGKQRYYCHGCNHHFSDFDLYKMTKIEKRMFSVLYRIFNADFENLYDFIQTLKNAYKNTDELELDKIGIRTDYIVNHGDAITYECYNPKFIISFENNKMQLLKIPPANKNTKFKTRNIVIREKFE